MKSAADCPPTASQRRLDNVRSRTRPRADDVGVFEKVRTGLASEWFVIFESHAWRKRDYSLAAKTTIYRQEGLKNCGNPDAPPLLRPVVCGPRRRPRRRLFSLASERQSSRAWAHRRDRHSQGRRPFYARRPERSETFV